MLKIYKNKGVSLIELMVSVGLGLILILSMLAFYSISLQNTVDYHVVNREQQQLRKMMNLLETDIENTGGFECASPDQIYAFPKNDILRVPTNIISLGDDLVHKQVVFVHPIISEYQHTALGILDFDKNTKHLNSYIPTLIEDAACGQDQSSIYIGATVLEMIPINNITTNTDYSATAQNIMAFVALSAVQSRREGGHNVIGNNDAYTPKMDDATVMFLSNPNNNPDIPFGNNTVDIFLGFSPEATKDITYTHVPDSIITTEQDLKIGGWINPFASNDNYALVVDKSVTNNTPEPNLLSKFLHSSSDNIGSQINTYPLKPTLIKQVRAIKFQFTFGAHNGSEAKTLTRVIRFKNTHLMKIGKK